MPYKITPSKIPITYRLFNIFTVMFSMAAFLASPLSHGNDVISLPEAIAKTYQQHPDLVTYGYQHKALNYLVEQAKVGTPKTVNLTIDDAFGSGDLSGISALQTTLSLSWLLEQEQITSRVNVAKQQLKTSDIQRRITALDLAANTARLYIILLTQQEQLKLAKIAETQTQNVLTQIEARVAAGKTNLVDRYRAKASLAQQTLEVEDLTHEIEATKAQLAAQWQGDNNFSVTGRLKDLPNEKQLNGLLTKLNQHPKLAFFTNRQAVAKAKAAEAQANAKPNWQVSAGIKHNQLLEDVAISASLSIPFTPANRNDAQIASYQAQINQQDAEASAWRKSVATDLLLLTHQLKHNRHVVEGLSEEVLPALQLANEHAQQAYRLGSYRYTDWYAVQQEQLQSQKQLIQAYSQVHLLNIEVERLTGSSLLNFTN